MIMEQPPAERGWDGFGVPEGRARIPFCLDTGDSFCGCGPSQDCGEWGWGPGLDRYRGSPAGTGLMAGMPHLARGSRTPGD